MANRCAACIAVKINDLIIHEKNCRAVEVEKEIRSRYESQQIHLTQDSLKFLVDLNLSEQARLSPKEAK